ncbi:Chromosome partition protein Smc [Microbulbifer aggregans]|uniref:Chromosome partition protein Smc n=2 Tax=Microbulbifer aggregans TaxID=1769779 RepID=A0A1C9W941_9GAMM|nr:Chromosome partition protein Smc [Microbulbifer aggregans]
MAVLRYSSLILAGLLVVGAQAAVGQSQASLTAEKNRLARMEQSQENRQVEIEDIENELLSYDYKLERAKESLDKARRKYEVSRRELQQAKRDHQLNTSSDTERQLRKAEHGFAMAERGVDSRTRRVEFLQSNYDELNGQLQEIRDGVTAGDRRIAQQKEKIENLVAALLAKAEKERRDAAVAKAAAPVSKPEVPAPSVAEASSSIAQESSVEAEVEPLREVDPELLDYVRRERERLEKLLADGDEGKHTFRYLELKPTRGESIPFEFLGHNQYRLVAPVEAGRQTYEINTWKFRRTIPADDAGVPYVFIFDARRLSRPRLVMYPEYALKSVEADAR